MKLVIEFANPSELEAQLLGLLSWLNPKQEAPVEEAIDTAPAPDVEKAPEVEQDAKPGMTREQLKAELKNRGIEFNTRCATVTLQNMLDKAEAAEAAPAPLPESGDGSGESSSQEAPLTVVPDPSPEATPPASPVEDDLFGEEATVYDKATVRAKLVAYIEKVGGEGQAQAIDILKEVSGVTRLADVDEQYYSAVVDRLAQ